MADDTRRTNQRNYYRVLYVQPDAPFEIIQASYRTLMQKLKAHPDLGGDEWNAQVINEAFGVLSDEASRRAYDDELFGRSSWKSLGQQTPAQREQGYAPDSTWEDFRPIRL
ncbi:MAG: J domain-containing protein [Gammaproteobacteria bacterium]